MPDIPHGITAFLWKPEDVDCPLKDKSLAKRMRALLKESTDPDLRVMSEDVAHWMRKLRAAAKTKTHRLVLLFRGVELLGFLYQDVVDARYGRFKVPCIQVYLVRIELYGKGYGGGAPVEAAGRHDDGGPHRRRRLWEERGVLGSFAAGGDQEWEDLLPPGRHGPRRQKDRPGGG